MMSCIPGLKVLVCRENDLVLVRWSKFSVAVFVISRIDTAFHPNKLESSEVRISYILNTKGFQISPLVRTNMVRVHCSIRV